MPFAAHRAHSVKYSATILNETKFKKRNLFISLFLPLHNVRKKDFDLKSVFNGGSRTQVCRTVCSIIHLRNAISPFGSFGCLRSIQCQWIYCCFCRDFNGNFMQIYFNFAKKCYYWICQGQFSRTRLFSVQF